jgi:hypothetical protein
MPLLIANDLIFQSIDNLTHVDTQINALLSDFRVFEHNFDSSLLADQPVKLSLNKLLNIAKTKDKAYINDISALHASLGYLTTEGVSNSITYLTYLNFIIMMLVTVFLLFKFGCVGLLFTAPPTKALSMEETIFKQFELAEWFDICIILILFGTFIVFLLHKRKRPDFVSNIYLTFFSSSEEFTVFLTSTALYMLPNGRLLTNGTVPSFRLNVILSIDWDEIILQNFEINVPLPTHVMLSPYQYFKLRQILPDLKNVQLTAHLPNNRPSLISWVIPFVYPPTYLTSN